MVGERTPGDWFVEDVGDRGERFIIRAEGVDYEIAVLEGGETEGAQESAEADAHIMAAAPKLLRALEELARAGNASTRKVWFGMSPEWRAEVRAAIAEARGE